MAPEVAAALKGAPHRPSGPFVQHEPSLASRLGGRPLGQLQTVILTLAPTQDRCLSMQGMAP